LNKGESVWYIEWAFRRNRGVDFRTAGKGFEMDDELNAYEIIEIAEKIERNGAKFYRRAAVVCNDPELSTFFVELAQWESRHIDIFRRMKGQLAEHNWEKGHIAPGRIESMNARTMAGLAVFGIHPDPADELTGHESKKDILRLAIGKEKDSIVYYEGLKDFVPREADKEVIDEVIQEEMKHVRILTQSLEQQG
jgi:rubrerythrin